MKCKISPQKNDKKYITLHITLITNWNKRNKNKNIRTKQTALLSAKAGIHHTAIPMERKQG